MFWFCDDGYFGFSVTALISIVSRCSRQLFISVVASSSVAGRHPRPAVAEERFYKVSSCADKFVQSGGVTGSSASQEIIM